MGSILGALSRANATLGSAAGAKLAVWECVELAYGLSASVSLRTERRRNQAGGGEGRRDGGGGGGCNFTAVSEEPAAASSFH